jgi:enediyne core biosynthesis thioesterase
MNLVASTDRQTGTPTPARSFNYLHTVSFEETNVVGNVYFSRHISWQGRCRELFLKRHADSIVDELAGDLRLVTLRVECEYFAELRALDDVDIRMTLAHLRQHRIGLAFQYVLTRGGREISAARGFQEVGCMRATAGGLAPCPVPASLATALEDFR